MDVGGLEGLRERRRRRIFEKRAAAMSVSSVFVRAVNFVGSRKK